MEPPRKRMKLDIIEEQSNIEEINITGVSGDESIEIIEISDEEDIDVTGISDEEEIDVTGISEDGGSTDELMTETHDPYIRHINGSKYFGRKWNKEEKQEIIRVMNLRGNLTDYEYSVAYKLYKRSRAC